MICCDIRSVIPCFRRGSRPPILADPVEVQFRIFDETLTPLSPIVTAASTNWPDNLGVESIAGYPGGFVLLYNKSIGKFE